MKTSAARHGDNPSPRSKNCSAFPRQPTIGGVDDVRAAARRRRRRRGRGQASRAVLPRRGRLRSRRRGLPRPGRPATSGHPQARRRRAPRADPGHQRRKRRGWDQGRVPRDQGRRVLPHAPISRRGRGGRAARRRLPRGGRGREGPRLGDQAAMRCGETGGGRGGRGRGHGGDRRPCQTALERTVGPGAGGHRSGARPAARLHPVRHWTRRATHRPPESAPHQSGGVSVDRRPLPPGRRAPG